DSIQHTKEFVNKMDSLSRSLELPVGLSNNIVSQVAHRKERGTDLWLKLLGIFISGFAASFGAPFWFNLLKKANPVTPK
ncbi:MAG TPA: hypothetical protein VM187_15660, partial [Niastella sp.]|nr:hypothetical protein [Niastella sp.]